MTFSSDDIVRAMSCLPSTPDLEGEEVTRLMEDIEHVSSPEEAKRRMDAIYELRISRLMTKRVDELKTKPLRKA